MISLALVSALVTGVVAHQQASSAMQFEAEGKLFSLLESREAALKRYFDTIRRDVVYHSQSSLVIDALAQFSNAWSALEPRAAKYLTRHYVVNNPYGLGLRSHLLDASDASDYSAAHRKFHAQFTRLRAARSFHDIFLIDAAGNIIYSAAKESDFGTNLLTGPWKESNLAATYKSIHHAPAIGDIVYADFAPYAPSSGAAASFIAAPIFDADKRFVGAIAFQMPIDQLNNVMQVTAGIGDTGETYLVGSDLLMRSDSRFYAGRSILKRKVETEPARLALTGEEGVGPALDYRDIRVFSAYKPIDFLGTRMALLAEVDEAEVMASAYRLNNLLTISGVVIAIAITFLGYLLASDLAHPIVTMTRAMSRLSENDLTVNISVSERRDEVGGMANAIIKLKDFSIERERLREKLSFMAQHDALTNLPNREFALAHLEELVAKSADSNEPLTVMFADLDGFKQVNDTFGHQVGDQLLTEISSRFLYCLREDDMVARLGGDEFLFILPATGERSETSRIAKKLLASLKKSFVTSDSALMVSVSIGIAILPTNARDTRNLLKAADQAMYRAKKAGKDNFAFANDDEQNETALRVEWPGITNS